MLSTCFRECEVFHRDYEYVPERHRQVQERSMVDNFDGLYDAARNLKSSQLKKRQSVNLLSDDPRERQVQRAELQIQRAQERLQKARANKDATKRQKISMTADEIQQFELFKQQRQQMMQQPVSLSGFMAH